MSRFYITTPIYYINASPHLGHAYTTLVADAVARAHRLMGDDVMFLTGTDEHGQKVERAAQKAGLAPQVFADQIAQQFSDLVPLLNASNDDFIRTTEPRHHASVQALWRRVRDNGYIYKGSYEGWYCTVDEVFVPETQLVDGRCNLCGNPVEKLSEASYFFKLSAFQQPLLDHYRNHPDFVTPAIRKNEMLAFLEAGLEDLSVSRTSFTWGIPVPDDPKHVMYVWFDALTNYMTAAGYGSNDPADVERFEKFWPANVHLIGKEIVRQHAIYWPAFLLAAGLPLPRQVVSHGWWLMDGAKMSKSKGNVVRPADYIAQFGLDAFRYFVYREMVFGQDASFTDEAVLGRYNADLANDLGNLASRVMTLLHRSCGGVVPSPDSGLLDRPEEQALLAATSALTTSVPDAVRGFQLSVALREIWDVIGATNRYIVVREPWRLAKDPSRRAELETSLYATADTLRVVAELLRPFVPGTAERLLQMLGQPLHASSWSTLANRQLTAGTTLGETVALFPRIELTVEALQQMSNESSSTPQSSPAAAAPADVAPPAPAPAAAPAATPAPAAAAPAAPAAELISYEDFMKVDLRVAKVLTAERVPKSKKLMKLLVDTGVDQRTIVAGIAEAYEPDALVGRTLAIVFNLKPAKLMGIESNGMVLAGSVEGGKPVLVSFEEPLPPGSRVR
ncbi:MAG: methionine--tRNA ligase [Vicinamibacterales bacterium]